MIYSNEFKEKINDFKLSIKNLIKFLSVFGNSESFYTPIVEVDFEQLANPVLLTIEEIPCSDLCKLGWTQEDSLQTRAYTYDKINSKEVSDIIDNEAESIIIIDGITRKYIIAENYTHFIHYDHFINDDVIQMVKKMAEDGIIVDTGETDVDETESQVPILKIVNDKMCNIINDEMRLIVPFNKTNTADCEYGATIIERDGDNTKYICIGVNTIPFMQEEE